MILYGPYLNSLASPEAILQKLKNGEELMQPLTKVVFFVEYGEKEEAKTLCNTLKSSTVQPQYLFTIKKYGARYGLE